MLNNKEHENKSSVRIQNDVNNEDIRKSKFRKAVLAQTIAGIVTSLLIIGNGAAFAIISLIIASLTSENDVISVTPYQLSWIGSMPFIIFALSSPFSGMITGPLGRKKGMLIMNLVDIIAWILLWRATSVSMIFPAIVIFGVQTGMTTGAVMSYIVETSEPATRSILLTFCVCNFDFGATIAFFIGTTTSWRTTAAVFMFIPILFTSLMLMLPESPVWLIANSRNEDALKSLCWLRGWTKPTEVKEEYLTMISKTSKCSSCSDSESISLKSKIHQCSYESDSLFLRIRNNVILLKSRETARPLILAMCFLMFSTLTGYNSIGPSLVNIFRAFDVPLDANWVRVGFSMLSMLGHVICTALAKVAGKRTIVLTGMTISVLSTMSLGFLAYKHIPHHISSYRTVRVSERGTFIPLFFLAVLWLSNAIGILPIGWILPSEILPYATRSFATGVTYAISGVFSFATTKIHVHIEDIFGIYGSFFVYSGFTIAGTIYCYLFLVETKGKTIEEIGTEFSGKEIKIFADDCFANKIKQIQLLKTVRCHPAS